MSEHAVSNCKYFFPEEIADPKWKENESLIANSLYEVLRQEKPFSNEKLNKKLFERMLECIRDSSTHPAQSLPAIFVVTAFIQGESELLTATRMATRFVDGLFGMIESAKVF